MRLSKGEFDIIEKIVSYGGYVTKEMLCLYRNDITIDRCYRLLKQLEQKGYIRQRNYFGSTIEPMVYQVTRKACALFERPEAYMRKLHKPYAIRRYLIRAHFLLSLAGKHIPISYISSAERLLFLKEIGYPSAVLPRKYNKGMPTLQMEDYILTFPTTKTIYILYANNSRFKYHAQIQTLYQTYGAMIRANVRPISFLFLVEHQEETICCKQYAAQMNLPKNTRIIFHNINRNYESQAHTH